MPPVEPATRPGDLWLLGNHLKSQSGDDPELRARSAAGLKAIGFDGYAVGGLAVGEPQEVIDPDGSSEGWIPTDDGAFVPEGLLDLDARHVGRRVRDGLVPETVQLDADQPADPATLTASPERVVLIPAGHTEQHGYHLPLGTDWLMATYMARRAAENVGGVVAARVSGAGGLPAARLFLAPPAVVAGWAARRMTGAAARATAFCLHRVRRAFQ